MKYGKIRTKETCPICKRPFPEPKNLRVGLECPEHKTRPRRYFIDIWWKGQQKIYSDGNDQVLSSWDQAYLCLALINKEIREGVFDPSKYFKKDKSKFWTMQLLTQFWEMKLREIAPSSRNNYKVMTAEAKAFFKNQDVREIRELDLDRYKRHLEDEGKKEKTLKCYLDLFRVFLNDCHKRLRIINLVPIFPKINVPESSFRWLDADEQRKIWECIPTGDRPIFDFMALHGCRPAEARAIRIQDIDLRTETITIRSTWSGRELRNSRKGRGSRPVVIAVHDELLEFVSSRASQTLPGAFLFVNPRTGNPYSQNRLRRVWDKVRVKAGIDKQLRLYDATRHSFASQLVNAGEDLDRVRELLGHTSSKTTMRYAHHSLAGKKAALRKLSLRKVVDYPQTIPSAKAEEKS